MERITCSKVVPATPDNNSPTLGNDLLLPSHRVPVPAVWTTDILVVGNSKGLGANDHDILIAVKDPSDSDPVAQSPNLNIDPSVRLTCVSSVSVSVLPFYLYSALPLSGDAVFLSSLLGRVGAVFCG